MDPGGRLALLGGFDNKFERDLILNELCIKLGFSGPFPARSRAVGTLNDFDPEELVGTYDAGSLGRYELMKNKDQLTLALPGAGGNLKLKIDPDGLLYSTIPLPSLWLEPFRESAQDRIVLMVSQVACLRTNA